ncbi:hypothetical protein BU14_0322s0018 [Porphyra umbilicalis]|uniref:Uncharacterized protein n=1 Tax=Porphyra umbilicalis TaxID=2786 RepID=A0A1X6NZ56_PORUM|nr:hypothetical protein BU14_0322s0018 [Porphyra umbilicalis]|eukprot:OSX73884.1 hypothetical protein BU14_0322s0018 [Porphyra umbilicalis]
MAGGASSPSPSATRGGSATAGGGGWPTRAPWPSCASAARQWGWGRGGVGAPGAAAAGSGGGHVGGGRPARLFGLLGGGAGAGGDGAGCGAAPAAASGDGGGGAAAAGDGGGAPPPTPPRGLVEFVWEYGAPLRGGGGEAAFAGGLARLAGTTLRRVTVRRCVGFNGGHPAVAALLAAHPRLSLTVEGRPRGGGGRAPSARSSAPRGPQQPPARRFGGVGWLPLPRERIARASRKGGTLLPRSASDASAQFGACGQHGAARCPASAAGAAAQHMGKWARASTGLGRPRALARVRPPSTGACQQPVNRLSTHTPQAPGRASAWSSCVSV